MYAQKGTSAELVMTQTTCKLRRHTHTTHLLTRASDKCCYCSSRSISCRPAPVNAAISKQTITLIVLMMSNRVQAFLQQQNNATPPAVLICCCCCWYNYAMLVQLLQSHKCRMSANGPFPFMPKSLARQQSTTDETTKVDSVAWL